MAVVPVGMEQADDHGVEGGTELRQAAAQLVDLDEI